MTKRARRFGTSIRLGFVSSLLSLSTPVAAGKAGRVILCPWAAEPRTTRCSTVSVAARRAHGGADSKVAKTAPGAAAGVARQSREPWIDLGACPRPPSHER